MAQDLFATSSDQDLRKRWALMQLQQASDASPVQHPLQAVARVLQGAIGGYIANKAAEDDRNAGAAMFNTLPGLGGAAQPATPSAASAQPSSGDYGSAISSIESGGKYDALGPVTKTGDRAYGKYQVMGANVGPWTKEVLGQEMTPQQFAASPQAQDAVFNAKFGQYAQKYGPEGAARAWFAGEGGMNNLGAKDQLGTTVGAYGQKFAQNLTGSQLPEGAQPAQYQGQQAPGPARSQLNIPPEVAATIKQLGSDPRTRPQAWQLYMQYAKPVEAVSPMSADERKQWNVPDGVSAGIDRTTGKPVFSQPANSVSVNTAANPIYEGVAKQIVDQRKNAQTAAYETIPAVHEARKAVEQGAITGAFAQGRMDLAKVGSLFGVSDPQAVQNTEVLRAAVGQGVLAHIKALGANPSNADRDYIEKIQGGQISLEENSIKKILDIQEKYARQAIRNFNRDSQKLMGVQGGDQAYKSIAPLMSIDEPPDYQPSQAPTATPAGAAPAQPAAPGKVRRFNPATGKIE